MSTIKSVLAREILDSRGTPTIEVDVCLTSGSWGRFSVPSGASTGEHEALELRDQDVRRYFGKGVQTAVSNVQNKIAPALIGKNPENQQEIDDLLIKLDGTPNKSVLGANAILGVSMATFKAVCAEQKKPLYRALHVDREVTLPVPMINVINGGEHANNGLSVQEFMIVPYGAPTFAECMRYGSEIFHTLKKLLHEKKMSTAVGDEGGFAPDLKDNREALDLLVLAIEKAGYSLKNQVGIALDVAASEFYDVQSKTYRLGENETKSPEAMIQWFESLQESYPILSIEDGLDQNDWDGWKALTQKMSNRVQLVGDDLFVTNPKMVQRGIEANVANAVLIKPNQIGTLSETLATIKIAQKNSYNTVMSHRSGETEDCTIADLAIMTACNQIKTGSLSRSERISKYNRLLRIEEEMTSHVKFFGKDAFKRWLD